MKMNRKYLFALILILLGSQFYPNYAQEINLQNNLNSTNAHKTEISVFNQISEGINDGNVAKLINYFTTQPYISLPNGVNGYYSSNQVYYILEKFFQEFKVLSFKFETKSFENNTVYGTGTYYYERKGKRDSTLLYITLNKIGNKWRLSQLSVN